MPDLADNVEMVLYWNQLLDILLEMGVPEHLVILIRALDEKSEWKMRINISKWFQAGREVKQICILSLELFNLYREYII